MKQILKRIFNHEELSREEACSLMRNMVGGSINDAQTAALLAAFQMRGVTVDELIGFRDALLQTRVPVSLQEFQPIDIVGTGGDGKNTFNISTCACFVVAGAGYHVAKHGNYGATSVSGASNVMELYGVRFTNETDKLKRSMEGCGMTYLHAPLFNPALKTVAPVRKALGVRTLFNLLGPLVNPCLPSFQLLGVADLAQMRLYTNTLQRLGIRFAVVNNLDGYDEISLTDEFKVMTNRYETIYRPSELGFSIARQEELYGGSTPEEAVRIFGNVLQNKATRAQTDCVLINASFAIQAMKPASSIEACVAEARESLESGKAFHTFRRFLERRGMKQALAAPPHGIIAEFKRHSPSKGWIHQEADSAVIPPAYEKAGAAALSILTDTPFFKGSLKDIRTARPLVQLPILRKDFIISPYQIYQAKAVQADAILLIAAALTPAECRTLAHTAHELHLEVLMEIHHERELDCLNEDVDMVGVNNRNLGTFHTDPGNSFRLASLLPHDVLKVSESGLSSPALLRELRDAGFRGFLIGETFMRTYNPGRALSDFIQSLEL